MYELNLITKNDLYNLSEKEIMEKIENCKRDDIVQTFNKWKNLEKVYESDILVENTYCKSIKAKIRYINPLVREEENYVRIKKISEDAKRDINNCLEFKTKKYAYFDFGF